MAKKKAKATTKATATRASRPVPGGKLALWVYGLALLGVLVAFHLFIQIRNGFNRGCLGFSAPTGEIAECSAVVGSEAGTLLGVSNPVWGMLFYIAVALLAFLGARQVSQRRLFRGLRLALVAIGFVYSAYLVMYQSMALGEYCVLCLISAGIVTVLFALHVWQFLKRYDWGWTAALTSAGLRPYLFGALGLVALGLVDYLYFKDKGLDASEQTAQAVAPPTALADTAAAEPPPPGTCKYTDADPLSTFETLISNAYSNGADGPVRVLKVFDPNCPHCKTLGGIIDPIVASAENVKFHYLPIPLWGYSIPQIQALELARSAGRFEEMMAAQFAKQRAGGLDVKALGRIASDIGMDAQRLEADIRGGKHLVQAQRNRSAIFAAGVTSVPQLLIEGRWVDFSSFNTGCISQMINEAAEEISSE